MMHFSCIPPHNWKSHHHNYILFFPQSGSFLVHLILAVLTEKSYWTDFVFTFFTYAVFSLTCDGFGAMLNTSPYGQHPLGWVFCVSCLSSFSPFDFTQNCMYLLPPLIEFVYFTICFILCCSGKVVILIIHPPTDHPQLSLSSATTKRSTRESCRKWTSWDS